MSYYAVTYAVSCAVSYAVGFVIESVSYLVIVPVSSVIKSVSFGPRSVIWFCGSVIWSELCLSVSLLFVCQSVCQSDLLGITC